jgi:hypothetical protein
MRAAWGIQMRSGESDIEDRFERHRKKGSMRQHRKVWYILGGETANAQHQSEI